MSRRAALYIRVRPADDVEEALRAWQAAQGFVPWDALPPGYPRDPEEHRELVYRGAEAGWAVVVPEAFEHLFRFGLELSRAPGGLTVLALSDTWVGGAQLKLYREGRVLLKAGEDRDAELPYFIPLSEPVHFDAAAATLDLPAADRPALQRWGRQIADGAAPTFVAAACALALPELPATFAERRAQAEAAPGAPYGYLLYVSKRSPLYRNA